jgi:hypothetical protein
VTTHTLVQEVKLGSRRRLDLGDRWPITVYGVPHYGKIVEFILPNGAKPESAITDSFLVEFSFAVDGNPTCL